VFHTDALGAFEPGLGALDKQRAQVGVTAATDRAQACMTATGMLARQEAEPCRQLSAVLELAGRADTGDQRIGSERAHADDDRLFKMFDPMI